MIGRSVEHCLSTCSINESYFETYCKDRFDCQEWKKNRPVPLYALHAAPCPGASLDLQTCFSACVTGLARSLLNENQNVV